MGHDEISYYVLRAVFSSIIGWDMIRLARKRWALKRVAWALLSGGVFFFILVLLYVLVALQVLTVDQYRIPASIVGILLFGSWYYLIRQL